MCEENAALSAEKPPCAAAKGNIIHVRSACKNLADLDVLQLQEMLLNEFNGHVGCTAASHTNRTKTIRWRNVADQSF
jgi:hypothetical protein